MLPKRYARRALFYLLQYLQKRYTHTDWKYSKVFGIHLCTEIYVVSQEGSFSGIKLVRIFAAFVECFECLQSFHSHVLSHVSRAFHMYMVSFLVQRPVTSTKAALLSERHFVDILKLVLFILRKLPEVNRNFLFLILKIASAISCYYRAARWVANYLHQEDFLWHSWMSMKRRLVYAQNGISLQSTERTSIRTSRTSEAIN